MDLKGTPIEVAIGPYEVYTDTLYGRKTAFEAFVTLRDDAGRVQYHFVLIDYLCRPIAGTLAHGSDVAAAELVDPSRNPRRGDPPPF